MSRRPELVALLSRTVVVLAVGALATALLVWAAATPRPPRVISVPTSSTWVTHGYDDVELRPVSEINAPKFVGARAESSVLDRLLGWLSIGVVVLAAVAVLALLLRALWRVQDVDPGFRADGVVTARTVLPSPKYEPVARREQFYDRVLRDVRAVPGVTSAAYTSFLPMVMRGGIWKVITPGKTPDDAASASVRFVTPEYFTTMSIPVLQGRGVETGDTQASVPSNTRVQCSRVSRAKMAAKRSRIAGHALRSCCAGRASGERPRPFSRAA